MSKQVRKNVFGLAVGAVVAAALGLYAYFGALKGEEKQRAREKQEASFLSPVAGDAGFTPVEYTQLVIESPAGSTTLQKQGDGWRIVLPVNAPADPFVMDAVKTQLDTLGFEKIVEENPKPEDLKKYGLAPPAFTVHVWARPRGGGGEPKELVLRGGGENTFDGSIYAQRDDDPRVYAVPGGARFGLLKSTMDLRDKQLMKLPAKEITRAEVTTPQHSFVFERQGKIWKLLKPEETNADPQAIAAYLGGFDRPLAKTFQVDSSDERARDGLDHPLATAVFTREKGDPIRIVLGFVKEAGADGGSPADGGAGMAAAPGRYFVLRMEGHETTIAEVGQDAFGVIDHDPVTLRDRAVVSFEKEKVAKLEFLKGASRIVVVRDVGDGGSMESWRVVEPAQGPAKKFKLTSILWTLGSLKALKVVEDAPKSWAKWGLDKPQQEARLYDADGKLLATLAVGNAVEGEEDTHYARGTRNQVVEMKTERLVDLPSTVDDVIDVARTATTGADAGR